MILCGRQNLNVASVARVSSSHKSDRRSLTREQAQKRLDVAQGHPLEREFEKLTRAAGLGDWAPYELRHSAASLLVAARVPIDEVADLLGHKDATTLLAVYRHNVALAVDAGSAALEFVSDNVG